MQSYSMSIYEMSEILKKTRLAYDSIEELKLRKDILTNEILKNYNIDVKNDFDGIHVNLSEETQVCIDKSFLGIFNDIVFINGIKRVSESEDFDIEGKWIFNCYQIEDLIKIDDYCLEELERMKSPNFEIRSKVIMELGNYLKDEGLEVEIDVFKTRINHEKFQIKSFHPGFIEITSLDGIYNKKFILEKNILKHVQILNKTVGNFCNQIANRQFDSNGFNMALIIDELYNDFNVDIIYDDFLNIKQLVIKEEGIIFHVFSVLHSSYVDEFTSDNYIKVIMNYYNYKFQFQDDTEYAIAEEIRKTIKLNKKIEHILTEL